MQNWLTTAKLHLEAAKILKNSNQFSNTIYHLQQSFEKALKSFHAYLMISSGCNNEHAIEKRFRDLSHSTKESILNLLIEICDSEDRNWAEKGSTGKIHSLKELLKEIDSNVEVSKQIDENTLRTLRSLNDFISSLKEKLVKMKEEKEDDIRNIINNYDKVVTDKYSKYKSLEGLISMKENEIIKENRLHIDKMSDTSKRFEYLLGCGILLYEPLTKLEAISRYPDKGFKWTNIDLLNRPQMKAPCCKLIEILDHLISVIQKSITKERAQLERMNQKMENLKSK